MLAQVKALLTDGRSVSISISCVEIAFINSFTASFAAHVFEVVDLLRFVSHFFKDIFAEDSSVRDLVDDLFALRTLVFHFSHPFLNAWVAVLVRARIQA